MIAIKKLVWNTDDPNYHYTYCLVSSKFYSVGYEDGLWYANWDASIVAMHDDRLLKELAQQEFEKLIRSALEITL